MSVKLGGTAAVQNATSEFLLEYYLMEDQAQNYGVKIKKKEKKAGDIVLCEDYVSDYTITDKGSANAVLELLVKNTVTPTTAGAVLQDLGYFEKWNN